MTRTVVIGAVVALVAAGVAVGGTAIGITTVWPVLLAAAVGLAAAQVTLGRAVAFVVGALVSWFALALRAGVLPAVPVTRGIVVAVGVVLLTVLAAATRDRLPLWAGLAGYAAFAAFYEPIFAATPTAFPAQSPVALVTVLLAAALGLGAATLAHLVTSGAVTATRDRIEAGPGLSEGGAA